MMTARVRLSQLLLSVCVIALCTATSTLASPVTVLKGHVTDQATTLPVSGAAITLYGAGFLTVTTDANGDYAIDGGQWPFTGSATMWIVKPGYFTPVLSVNIVTPFPVTVDRALIPGGPIVSGTVTDSITALPIANASVLYSSGSFYPGATTRSVQTDINGHYNIDSSDFNESAASGATMSMTVSGSGYLQSSASVTAAPVYPTTKNFSLTPASTTLLKGHVTDQATTLPVSGATVTLYGAGFLTVTTDANGNYAITGLQWPYTGSATMWIVKPGYFTPVLSVNIVTPFPVTVDRALIPGGPIVSGTVTDANTALVIANANVLYSSGNFYPGATTRSVQTDLTGHYSIDSSDFNESAALGTTMSMTVNSTPGYFQTSTNVTANPPFPLTKNFAMVPTGVTETIAVATQPPGLNITVDTVALAATQTFTWTPGNPHAIATASPQPGPVGTQYVFANWSNGGTMSQTIVTPAANTTYTANFTTQYQLTTASNPVAGGSITAGGWFNPGDTVNITATPLPGYQFTGFSGDLSGIANAQPLVMTGPKSVVANFSEVTNTVLGSLTPTTWGQSVTFTATVSAPAGGTPAGTLQFKIDGVNFGAAVTLIGGSATSAATTTLPTGSHTITAVYNGNANFGASTSLTLFQVVNQASQTITFGTLSNQAYGTAPFSVSATASSSLPVSFASTTPLVCTVSGSMVTLVAAGLCSIQASQAGDANYLAAPPLTQSFQVTRPSPPAITKSFGAASIPLNGTTSLTFSINNPNTGVALTGVAFTDFLPAGLVVATPNGLTTTCTGTATATAGSGSVSLSTATLAANASCTLSVNVQGTTGGVKNNSVTVTSTEGGTGNTSNASVTVVLPPAISKTFGTLLSIPVGGTDTLSFTISNPNVLVGLTGVAFTDTLPSGLVVANPNGVTGSCGGGTITAIPGSSTITLTGGNLAVADSCTFSVRVLGTREGVDTNLTSQVNSIEGGLGNTAAASIVVGTAFQIRYLSYLNAGDSFVNLTNAGINGGQDPAGDVCANVYVFAEDQQLIECCTCPLTPNHLMTLSGQNDLINNTLTPGVAKGVTVGLMVTANPTGNAAACDASAVTAATLTAGLRAYGTTLHPLPGGSYGVTETPFSPVALSASELLKLDQFCGFIKANGSGYGICGACRPGAQGAKKK